MRRIFLVVAGLMATIPSARAAELWEFIRVGKSFAERPKWDSRSGKAAVEVKNGRIDIRVSFSDDQDSSAPDKPGYESIKIVGILGSDNSIQATCTFPGTDRNPAKITGRYITRDDVEIWGQKRKIVTQREIVFSHPPNFEFFGFLKKDARDE